MGYLYQPKLRSGARCAVWWMRYYVSGRRKRASTGTEKRKEAERVMKEREGKVASGQPIVPRVDRIRYDEIATDLRTHYTTTGDRDLIEAEGRLAHLDAFFSGCRVIDITGARATEYVAKRQAEEAANGTINRELAVLGRMLRVAYKHNKLMRLPVIDKLKEAAPRQGFFEDDAYEAVRRRLRDDLQAALSIAHTFGWRMQSEVLTLEWRQVDLDKGTLRLDLGATKNDDGRIAYLTPELKTLLTAQRARVEALQRKATAVIPYVFPRLTGERRGQRIKDFRKAWTTACKRAGVPGMLRHDFRRTAVRNLERANVPRSVAMKITGHRTEAVYRRYAIVSDADLQEAVSRLTGTYRGTFRGTLEGSAVDGRAVSLQNHSTRL